MQAGATHTPLHTLHPLTVRKNGVSLTAHQRVVDMEMSVAMHIANPVVSLTRRVVATKELGVSLSIASLNKWILQR
jgi:hypothetical protein